MGKEPDSDMEQKIAALILYLPKDKKKGGRLSRKNKKKSNRYSRKMRLKIFNNLNY